MMYIRPRISPTLLLKESILVKGNKFTNHRYLGDPINAVKVFNELEVDELTLLEIGNGALDFRMLDKITSRAYMPLCYGGNITSLGDAETLFHLGFERLIVNSSFHQNPNLVEKIVEKFGSSSVSVTIDYKYRMFNKLTAFSKGGNHKVKETIEQLINKAAELKIGEVVLQNIDLEGSRQGPDLKLLAKVRSTTPMQLAVSTGVGSFQDVVNSCKAGADSVMVGDFFTFSGELKGLLLSYPEKCDLDTLYDEH